jgi:hypothetical protein
MMKAGLPYGVCGHTFIYNSFFYEQLTKWIHDPEEGPYEKVKEYTKVGEGWWPVG